MSEDNDQYLRTVDEGYTNPQLIERKMALLSRLSSKVRSRFISTFFYNKKHYEHFKTFNSVAGIRDVLTNLIYYDFDMKGDRTLEDVKNDTLIVINRLKDFGISNQQIKVIYSGNRSFHLYIDTIHSFTPTEVFAICTFLAKGITSFDTTMYDANQVFRIPLTRHEKTGLYSIPLTVEELDSLSIDEIKEMSKNIDEYDADEVDAFFEKNVTLPKELLDHRYDKVEFAISEFVISQQFKPADIDDINWNDRPKDMPPIKWLLEQGYYEAKERDHALMILGSTYKAMGYDATKCYYTLKASADKQATRTGTDKFSKKEIYKNIISQIYAPTWKGGTYSPKTDPLLVRLGSYIPEHINKDIVDSNIVTITESFQSFCDYAKEIDKNTIKFGIPVLDAKLVMQTGRLYGILAPPGVGKTTFGIDVIHNTSMFGEPSMFSSYDMSCPDVIQKLIQKHTRLSSDEIYKAFRENDQMKIKQFQEILTKNYKNVTFIFKTGQTIEDLKRSIVEREKQLGCPIRLVVVDYLELIQSKFSDPTQASMESIQGLREIAVGMNKAVIVMLQPSKLGTTIDEPLTSYTSAKGSSSIAQAVTAMLTLHRPGYSSRTPENDKYIGIDCVKNRSGSLFSLDLHFDGASGNLRALEQIEAQELYELREAKKQEKNNNGSSNNY